MGDIRKVQRRIARFICGKVDAATAVMQKDIAAGRPPRKFMSAIKRVWKTRKDGHYSIPVSKVPYPYSQLKVAFIKSATSSLDGWMMKISSSRMRKANTKEEAERARVIINGVVYHEVEHIFFSGTHVDRKKKDKMNAYIEYLIHPGEIRAYAKMYAYIFSQAFPGEPFDYRKMSRLSRDWQVYSAVYYFEVFNDAHFVKKYPRVRGIQKKARKLTKKLLEKEFRS